MPERTRAFLALLLPEELVREVARIQEWMRPLFPGSSVKWVDPGNFHLTLRFFGDLDRKGLQRAETVVQDLDGRFDSVQARLTQVSAFPSAARPQTLWVGVDDGAGRLEALAGEIDLRLRKAGFGSADKPWKSHLTVGRVRREAHLRLDPGWPAGLTCEPRNSTIGTVALMQSELRPKGAVYTPLRTAAASH